MIGIYGVSEPAGPRAAEALQRMVAGASGVHRSRARMLEAPGVVVAAYPRQGQEGAESVLDRDDVLIIVSGHLFHPKLTAEGPARLIGRLLDTDALSGGLAECVGEFAVVLVDKRSGEVSLVTDYLGVRPLFYAVTDAGVLFGTNVWPMFDSGRIAREVDADGLASWIQFNHPQGASTLFRQITKVPSGSVLRCRGRTVTASPYRHRRVGAAGEAGDLAELIHDIVSRSCQGLTQGHRSIAVLLSGGLDSRYVACLLKRQGIECEALTVPFESGDAAVAPMVADRLGVPLRSVPVPGSLDDAYQDPMGWSAAGFPIGKSVTCLPFERFDITGPTADGFLGDTLLRGSDVDGRSTAILGRARQSGSLPEAIVWKASPVDPLAVFRPELARRIRERVTAQVAAILEATDGPDEDKVTQWVLQNRKANWIAYNHLQNLEATETFHPFYSPELIECRLSHPYSHFTWDLYRRLFERFCPEAADLPHSKQVPKVFNAAHRWSWYHWRRVPGLVAALLSEAWARDAIRRDRVVPRLVCYGLRVKRWSYLARYLHPLATLTRRLEGSGLAVEWDRL